MKKHIDEIVSFVAAQMDGQQVPPHNSPALARLGEAVAAFQKNASDAALQMLGQRTLGAVIDRVCSNIAAEKTLQSFIRGGAHEA